MNKPVVVQAKQLGIIDTVKPVLDALLLHDYRLSAKLVAAVNLTPFQTHFQTDFSIRLRNLGII